MRGIAIAIVVLALAFATGYLGRGGSGLASDASGPATGEIGSAGAGATDAVASEPASAPESGERGGAAASPAKRIVYQWVDERGGVHFADSLDEVPVDWRGRAGQIELEAPKAARSAAASAASAGATRSVARVAAATPAHEVTIYTAPWCGWCRKTMAFLDERGVDYVNKDVEADPRWAEELHAKTGSGAVPLVEIDGTSIHGFDPGQMTSLLQ
ncbi:MAG: glutaredoxin family protein [Myxococcota bacterium]